MALAFRQMPLLGKLTKARSGRGTAEAAGTLVPGRRAELIHVSDPVGRFIYHFANKEFPLQTSVLGFVGTWDVPKDASGVPIKSGAVMLVFNYKKEDGSTGTFHLPKSAAIEHTTNQFIYTTRRTTRR